LAQDASTASAPAPAAAAPPAAAPASSTAIPSPNSPAGQAIINQIANGASPQAILNQLQQGQQPGSPPQGPQASSQTLSSGGSANTAALQFSTLEGAYGQRLLHSISQFGYDLIGNGGSVTALQIGAVQDDYILGPGDSINITLLGQQNASYTARVDRDGNVTFLNLAPISASGRTFGRFRAELEAAIKRAYLQTQVFVSVGAVRQLSVRVVGEVENPGVYAVTGLSTVLDALNLAGGVKKSGSLRNVTVVRGSRSYSIDLYSMLLTHGPTPDMSVAQGDRIVITPIGATAAISGDVRRPAIYEMPRGQKSMTARALLALANGPQVRGVYRETLVRIRPDGKEEYDDITSNLGTVVRDGEIMLVEKAVNQSLGRVTLTGAVRSPGDYGLNRMKTLQDLITGPDVFAPTPYLLLVVVKRLDPKTLTPILIPFSPLHVLEKKENLDLKSNDTVVILTVDTMRALANGDTLVQTTSPWAQGQPGAQANAPSASVVTNPLSLLTAPVPPGTSAVPSAQTMAAPSAVPGAPAAAAVPATIGTDAVTAFLTNGGLPASDASFFGHVLSEYHVTINGAVRDGGTFLVSPGTNLEELVAAAGGFTTDADLSGFELTSTTLNNVTGESITSRKVLHIQPAEYASYVLKTRDSITFHSVYTNRDGGEVTIAGEVRYPGVYPILRGERLSSVLARAGGLTDAAYPYGAVFTRAAVAQQESDARQRQADELESALAAYVTSASITADQANYITGLSGRLRSMQSTGRLAIEADPAVLAVKPQFDLVLDGGDHLTIPRRPASVSIMGEVLNPTSVIFDPSLSVSDYIAKAGGKTEMADGSKIFVVYPDGSASPSGSAFWSFGDKKLAPGSTIVVPRELTLPTNLLQLVTAVSGVVRDLALSAASIAVIGSHKP